MRNMMSSVVVIKKDGTRLIAAVELPELIRYGEIEEVTVQGWRFFPYSAPPVIQEEIGFLKSIIKKLTNENGDNK
jgi:hypothetical protein